MIRASRRLPGRAATRLWAHPLVLVLLAHTIFCVGIWNAREGYGEETWNVTAAFAALKSHQPSSWLYINVTALILKFLTPDPILALTLLKYISSLLATVGLYLVLSRFSNLLRRGAILCACFVWIASSLNAPFAQSTSLSLCSFGIMLLAIYCLLGNYSVVSLGGFYLFGLTAASMRPEYNVPLILFTLLLLGRVGWWAVKRVELRFGLPWRWACGIIVLGVVIGTGALGAIRPAALIGRTTYADQYALFGFAQCYADYYHRMHPQEVFSPMTEYRPLLNRTFNNPTGFADAIRKNPRETFRYFAHNATRNIFVNAPKALLGHFREQSQGGSHNFLYWGVRALLLAGGILGVVRLRRARWVWAGFLPKIPERLANWDSSGWKLLILVALISTSSAATLFLVGTPRYFLPWVPLYYLGVAYAVDSLFGVSGFGRFEKHLVVASGIVLCWPNYLHPRPNYGIDLIRQVAPEVRDHPCIAAWWADPYVVFGLYGEGEALSVSDGIQAADIERGRVDILVVDANFRVTKAWAEQRAFFEGFERQPERSGFRKQKGQPGSGLEVYYRPAGEIRNPKSEGPKSREQKPESRNR